MAVSHKCCMWRAPATFTATRNASATIYNDPASHAQAALQSWQSQQGCRASCEGAQAGRLWRGTPLRQGTPPLLRRQALQTGGPRRCRRWVTAEVARKRAGERRRLPPRAWRLLRSSCMSTRQAPCRPMRPAGARAVHTRRTPVKAVRRGEQMHENLGALQQELGALPQLPPQMRWEAPGRMRPRQWGQLGPSGGLKGEYPGQPARRAWGAPLHRPLPQTLLSARTPTRPPRTRRVPACACASRRRPRVRAGPQGRGLAGRAPRPRRIPGCSSMTQR